MRRFLAAPTVLGIIDSFGIELMHPRREGRSDQQIGKKGKSNQRGIVGGKCCLLLNHWGEMVDWGADTANVYDAVFQPLVEAVNGRMIVLGDSHFHAKTGDPANLKVWPRGTWNTRMLVETVLSMLTTICHCKKMTPRVWTYFETHLGLLVATFTVLIRWDGLHADETGFLPLTIAEFS